MVLSFSDEMEFNLFDINKIGCNLYDIVEDDVDDDDVDDDEFEQCDVMEYDDYCDGFGDDEDEDDEDCIVMLLFFFGSVSFGLNEFMEYVYGNVGFVSGVFIDEMVFFIIMYGNF